MPTQRRPINGYVELAPPQLLDLEWRELHFDLASDQNVLQDFAMPETGSGYVYRDAKLAGSLVHNRFIYWRTTNDILELVEMSSEIVLDDNQVRIRFVNSPIINDITVIEFSDSIVIMVATLTSVHRLYLPHPKTTNKSILHEITSENLFNTSNYYILGNQSSLNSQQPICAASWSDKALLKCALSFPDSSLLIVQFSRQSHHITTCDIKQTGIIGRLWSRMPNLWARNPNDCDNAVFVCAPFQHRETNDVLLFTLCRDCRIRVFSTNSRECVLNHNMIPQSSFSQSFASHTNPTTELPLMKIFGSQVVIYLTENRPEFVILDYSFEGGLHTLTERVTIQAPCWEKLVDFSMSQHNLWALSNLREAETTLSYVNIDRVNDDVVVDGSSLESVWDFVSLADDNETPSARSLVADIFWSNHFSVATVKKALTGIVGPPMLEQNSMEALEEHAFLRIVDDNQNEAWTRFYDYCLQNQHVANKSIGLVVAGDESIISIIKRSNPSYVCPWLVSVDMILQGGPYRGIEYSTQMMPVIGGIMGPLNQISTDTMSDESSKKFEQKLFESPSTILLFVEELVDSWVETRKMGLPSLSLSRKIPLSTAVDYICDQLDLSNEARKFNERALEEYSTRIRSEHNTLESNSGIILTYELFKRLVRARLILARDLLLYIHLVFKQSGEGGAAIDGTPDDSHESLYTSGRVKRITDILRCYGTLVWIAETPIKSQTFRIDTGVTDFIASSFEFFKKHNDSSSKPQVSSLDLVLHQNLLMNFLVKGGVHYSWLMSEMSHNHQALSNSYYVTDAALNLCKLLWPMTDHLCLPEFMLINQLDEHLNRYLDLTQDWLRTCNYDRHFLRAANCMLHHRAVEAVEIFNRLWMNVTYSNLLGRFIGLDRERSESASDRVPVNPSLIYQYYEKLIQLFQNLNNPHCLVMLINNCLALLDVDADSDQQHWVNCLRAKLFQYYLELEDSDEAYHTMVLTTDTSLRVNCLRKFIVYHCEKERWSDLLSYPFIYIKNDLIDILNQKADSLDLSTLNEDTFYKTSYYDLLCASYISNEEYKRAAEVMYNFAQRLAQEVPGVISIRKQAYCLGIALNSLRCLEDKDRYIECTTVQTRDDGRPSVLKRSHDHESEPTILNHLHSSDTSLSQKTNYGIGHKEIQRKYKLIQARLKLLEKDPVGNAIALSPLKPEETITQLVASSMFSTAVDLALLFKKSMEPILEGLTAKYMLAMPLSTVDLAVHQDLEKSLSDIFTDSYSVIDTYNYVANSTSPLVDKLWRLIDYYLITYDGVSHMYSQCQAVDGFSGTTVLMRTVASKLLLAGHEVPASLRRMYIMRNTAELLKLLMKYDRLLDAADLANEMVDKVLEPVNNFSLTSPLSMDPLPPVYLATHLIIMLVSYLNEDATNTKHIQAANILTSKLHKYREFVSSPPQL